VRIETAHGEIRELSDVTVAEVARAAKARNSPLRHPIVGAYSRSIGITLNIDDTIVEVTGNRRCAIPKVVHVRIFLTRPCRPPASRIRQHSLPARAGARAAAKACSSRRCLLDRLVLSLPEDLRAGLATMALEPAPSEATARLGMIEAARRIIEQQLDSYEDAQAKIGGALDTPEEIGRLREACGREGLKLLRDDH